MCKHIMEEHVGPTHTYAILEYCQDGSLQRHLQKLQAKGRRGDPLTIAERRDASLTIVFLVAFLIATSFLRYSTFASRSDAYAIGRLVLSTRNGMTCSSQTAGRAPDPIMDAIW